MSSPNSIASINQQGEERRWKQIMLVYIRKEGESKEGEVEMTLIREADGKSTVWVQSVG